VANARDYWRLALAHSHVVPLLGTRPMTARSRSAQGDPAPLENALTLLTAAGFCDRRSSLVAVGTWWHGGPGSSGPAALLMRYFSGELAFLAWTAVSGAVTWNTSSANFRWLASSCSAKL
jgi:hypothetical protein